MLIPVRLLKAMAACGNISYRYLLDCVRLQYHPVGNHRVSGWYLIATNGRVLVTVRLTADELPDPGVSVDFAIPRDLIQSFRAGKDVRVRDVGPEDNPWGLLELYHEGVASELVPAECMYPRWWDIFRDTGEETPSTLDANLLSKVCDVASVLAKHTRSDGAAMDIQLRGDSAAIIQGRWVHDGYTYQLGARLLPMTR
jgi:hypothetical protein